MEGCIWCLLRSDGVLYPPGTNGYVARMRIAR